jgi:hypothetical protein
LIRFEYKPSEKAEQKKLKEFWEDVSKILPNYILKPKYRIFGLPTDYNFMSVYKKDFLGKLGLSRPLMTLYVDLTPSTFFSGYFHVGTKNEMDIQIIQPVIDKIKRLGFEVLVTVERETI